MAQLRVLDVDEENGLEIKQVLGPVFAPIDSPEIVLSRACTHVLLQSIAALSSKKAEKNILSSSTITFVALSLAQRLERAGGADMAGINRIGDETDRLRAWGRLFEGSYRDRLDALVAEFFQEPPILSQDDGDLIPTPTGVSATCSERLAANLAVLAEEGGVVRVDTLILRLLDDPETRISRRLHTPENEEITEALREATAKLGGRSPRMVREAGPTELALRVEEYALALSTVLRTAEGEFTFALLGPWGSGKTTLTKVMEPLLKDPESFRRSANAGEDVFAIRKYSVVVHNAWKYRSRPECWIYAYRSLAEAANSSYGLIGRVLLALRVSVLRKGPWPLTVALLSLAVLAIPFKAWFQLAIFAVSTAGFFVALYLASVTTRATTRVHELFTQHLRLSPVNEKLGMLALVGDDIRALLSAWTRRLVDDPEDERPAGSPWPRLALPLFVLSTVGVLWLVGVLGWWNSGPNTAMTEPMPNPLPQAWINAFAAIQPSAPSGIPVAEFGVLIAWTMLAAFLLVLPWLVNVDHPNRVLMIVDDLDRCSPSEMLDVIEGMRLLVDDEELNSRLQILMLVDEAALNHGIAIRYDTMIRERAGEAGIPDDAAALRAARDEVVAEQNEKLFACHLRVARLTDADVEMLVSSLAGAELAALRQARREQQEARREKQRYEAAAALEQAAARREAADWHLQNVLDPKPLPPIDKNAPGKYQPSRRVQILTDFASFPPTDDEVRSRKRENERRNAYNSAQQRKTGDERQAEQIAAEQERDKAKNEEREAMRRVELLSNSSREQHEASPDRETPFGHDDIRFTAVDVEQLQMLMPAYFKEIGRRPSPRAIRILLFKIQLCRLLLQLRYPWRPSRAFPPLTESAGLPFRRIL